LSNPDIEKVLSISVEAHLTIDKMFKAVKLIRPKNILSNLEEINRSYERENAQIIEDPKRQHEIEKALIVIPLLHH
jgi:predicted Zn-ribbon and HTH transcriptional regulator